MYVFVCDFFFVVEKAKQIWKKLKDHHRYYTTKKAHGKGKSGDAAPDDPDDAEEDFEMRDELSFLDENEPSSLRKTMSLGNEEDHDETSLLGHFLMDETQSSNYSYSSEMSKGKKKDDRALEAATLMSKSLSKYLDNKSDHQQASGEPKFKHEHIWQQLEKLFEQLAEIDITDLNFLFVSETYKKIQANRATIYFDP